MRTLTALQTCKGVAFRLLQSAIVCLNWLSIQVVGPFLVWCTDCLSVSRCRLDSSASSFANCNDSVQHDRCIDLALLDYLCRFVASYPEFRKASATTSKHVAISSELSRQVPTARCSALNHRSRSRLSWTASTQRLVVITDLLSPTRYGQFPRKQ